MHPAMSGNTGRNALRITPRTSTAPDSCLAVAPVEHSSLLVLHPLGRTGSPLRCAGEGPWHAVHVDARLCAVLGGDADGRVAAVALARVDPARVTPTPILGGARGRTRQQESKQGSTRGASDRPLHGHRCLPQKSAP